MTKTEIEEFKKFMTERELYLSFATNYRRHRMTMNPATLEDYLERAKAESVIPQAFVYPDSVYGKDFWLGIQEEWLSALNSIRGTEQNRRCLDSLDLEVIELKQKSCSLGLPRNTCSLSLRGGNRLTLNVEHSRLVAKKLSTKMLLTRCRQSGDVVLLFNRSKGIDVKFKPGSSGLQFNNAELAGRLLELLGLDAAKEYFLLDCELLGDSGDNLLFMVKKR